MSRSLALIVPEINNYIIIANVSTTYDIYMLYALRMRVTVNQGTLYTINTVPLRMVFQQYLLVATTYLVYRYFVYLGVARIVCTMMSLHVRCGWASVAYHKPGWCLIPGTVYLYQSSLPAIILCVHRCSEKNCIIPW